MRKLTITSIVLGVVAWSVFWAFNYVIGSFLALSGIFAGYNALFKEVQISRVWPWVGIILNGSVLLYLAWLVVFMTF